MLFHHDGCDGMKHNFPQFVYLTNLPEADKKWQDSLLLLFQQSLAQTQVRKKMKNFVNDTFCPNVSFGLKNRIHAENSYLIFIFSLRNCNMIYNKNRMYFKNIIIIIKIISYILPALLFLVILFNSLRHDVR